MLKTLLATFSKALDGIVEKKSNSVLRRYLHTMHHDSE